MGFWLARLRTRVLGLLKAARWEMRDRRRKGAEQVLLGPAAYCETLSWNSLKCELFSHPPQPNMMPAIQMIHEQEIITPVSHAEFHINYSPCDMFPQCRFMASQLILDCLEVCAHMARGPEGWRVATSWPSLLNLMDFLATGRCLIYGILTCCHFYVVFKVPAALGTGAVAGAQTGHSLPTPAATFWSN